jgi:flagellar biosynthetic protein FliP
VLEYLGMVAAMLVGMWALDGARHLLLPGLTLGIDLETLLMATEMALGMAAWMGLRRHNGRSIAVMCAVMYVPFLVLLPLRWVGVLSGGALMTGGHLLMLLAMAVAMPFVHRGSSQHAHGEAAR